MAHVANVTIDSTKVSGDLTDYVVYIDLSDLPTTEFWGTVANGGGDIRVYKSDGTTQLAREVVSCDTATDTGELHVKFTGTLSSTVDTVIQIWVDGSSSEPAVTATYGRNAVWSDYAVVWHGNDNSTNSTGNGDGTSTGSSFITGQMGSAMEFTRNVQESNERVDFTFTPISPSAYALQMWFQHYTSSLSNYALSIADKDVTDNQIRVGHNEAATHKYGTFNFSPTRNAESGNLDAETNDDTWVHLVSRGETTASFDTVRDGDPAEAGHATGSSWSARTNLDRMTIGVSADSTPIRPLDGAVGEARLRWSFLSDNWIETEYKNQSSPSTFYTATAVAGTGYSLSLASGSLSLTGGVLDATASRRISLEGGTLSTAGGELTFATGRMLFLDSGGYDLTGGDQLHLVGRSLALSAGDFTLTGGVLDLTTAASLTLEAGSFTLTGGEVGFSYSASLDLAAGSYSLSGGELEVIQLVASSIDLAAGEFTLVGGDQVTSRSYVMPLAAGDMDLLGGVLDFSLATTIVLEAGTLSFNGGNLQFSFGIESTIVFPNKEGADEVDITQLEDGELAINLTHGKMYARDSRFNLFTVGGLYNAADLPRSDPGVSGAFWNDDGVLKVSA